VTIAPLRDDFFHVYRNIDAPGTVLKFVIHYEKIIQVKYLDLFFCLSRTIRTFFCSASRRPLIPYLDKKILFKVYYYFHVISRCLRYIINSI